jgi:methionyl aminopeptidase
MAITLKSPREIELIRRAGSVVAKVLSKLQELAEPGISTARLDEAAREIAAENRAECLFEGVKNPSGKIPFPGAICASINEQVVHGIPSESAILKNGDILSIDFGAKLEGYCADAAVTIPIGKIDQEKQRLIIVTKNALGIAIDSAKPGVKWSTIAGKMQSYVEKAGFSVVRDLVGHGIGTKMHEEPQVPNFVSRELLENDIILAEGMLLAVEPMINAGTAGVKTLKDGWTVVTGDGKCSAHFEHTIAVVKGGCEVMTKQF